jgi:hypothetical protein
MRMPPNSSARYMVSDDFPVPGSPVIWPLLLYGRVACTVRHISYACSVLMKSLILQKFIF